MGNRQLTLWEYLEGLPKRGRKKKDFSQIEQRILETMTAWACGRVPVASERISIHLLIEFGLDRSSSSIRADLLRLKEKGLVEQAGKHGEYRLANAFL